MILNLFVLIYHRFFHDYPLRQLDDPLHVLRERHLREVNRRISIQICRIVGWPLILCGMELRDSLLDYFSLRCWWSIDPSWQNRIDRTSREASECSPPHTHHPIEDIAPSRFLSTQYIEINENTRILMSERTCSKRNYADCGLASHFHRIFN